MTTPLMIRQCTTSDVPVLISFIRALAEYEKLSHEVVTTEEVLRDSLFGPDPKAHAILAYEGDIPVGFAIWFYNFSTFLGKHGLYVEDLFVLKEHRDKGIGKKLLQWLAKRAIDEGCGRMEWWVLDWNEPSLQFYRSLGAMAMDEWTVFRITRERIEQLAKST